MPQRPNQSVAQAVHWIYTPAFLYMLRVCSIKKKKKTKRIVELQSGKVSFQLSHDSERKYHMCVLQVTVKDLMKVDKKKTDIFQAALLKLPL